MTQGLVLVTPPAIEPLTLAEAKDHLRVDSTDEDSLIEPLITAARIYAETFTRRAFITRTYDLFLDGFPAETEICLPRPPLQSVTYLKYTDLGGNLVTISSGDYIVDTASQPGRLSLQYLKFWPTYQQIANSVRLRFVAGYGNAAADLPRSLQQAMLLIIGHWYENRETVAPGALAEVPMAAQSLLWSERISL